LKTVVTVFLDSVGITYQLKPHQRNIYTAEDAARERGVRLSQIVKCMIGKDPEGRYYVMMIPGHRTLKLKRAREVAGGVRITLVPREEIASELGLIVGAISPTQLIGRARFFMDESIFDEDFVDISSGEPDAGVELSTEDLQKVLDAERCEIVSSTAD